MQATTAHFEWPYPVVVASDQRGTRSAGVVLAAGASRRMGRAKQLLPVDGRPLLELVLAHAGGSRLDEVLVVLGAHVDEILERIDLGRAQVVVNPDHATGMASSLRLGLASLG